MADTGKMPLQPLLCYPKVIPFNTSINQHCVILHYCPQIEKKEFYILILLMYSLSMLIQLLNKFERSINL